MTITRVQKDLTINDIKSYLSDPSLYIVCFNYSKMSAAEFFDLRKSVYNSLFSKIFVFRNNLFKVAIKGTRFEKMFGSFLKGQVATVLTKDPIALSVVLKAHFKRDFSRILFLSSDSKVYSVEDILYFSNFSNIDSARSSFLAMLNTAMSSLLRLNLLRIDINSKNE